MDVWAAHTSSQGPPDQCLGSLPRAPLEPWNSSLGHTRCLGTCSAPGKHPGGFSLDCPRSPGAVARTPATGAALRAAGRAGPLLLPQSPLPGQALSPPSRAPASPRGHHHIVDDQVGRGQRPRALSLSRAAGFAGPGPGPAAPIPFRRCSRRGCRHVKRREHALLARAPPPRLATASGVEGRTRERRGRGRGAEPGTAPTAAAILEEGKDAPGPPAPPLASVATAIVEQGNHRRFCDPGNNLRRHLGLGQCCIWPYSTGLLFLPSGCFVVPGYSLSYNFRLCVGLIK